MLDGGATARGAAPEWQPDHDPYAALHARFQRRRQQQGAWDAEEARDLRTAEQMQLWTHYGCVSLVEYLEVRCGIDVRTALDRVRVSHALAELPLIEARLEEGELSFSHVKELTRVVVPDTEDEWVAHTAGMTYREVQRAVAGHVRGDRPTDPTQPDEHRRTWRLWLKPSTIARLNALLRQLEAERGDRFVDDDDKANALCDAVGAGERPPTQVWLTADGHAFANGTALDDAEAAALTCDATVMGSVEGPERRARATISNKRRQRLLARDGQKCTVPGCRSRRHLDLHHIVHVENGGDHRDSNLTTLCGGHHRLHHRGLLEITGTAPSGLTFRRARADDEQPSRPRGHEPVRDGPETS